MKLKQLIYLLLLIGSLLLTGCTTETKQEQPTANVTFADALGRTVQISAPERVGIASGSLADCWMLAGGEVCAVTRDAVEERNLDLPEDVIDLGSLKDPSLEAILAANLDFLILTPSLPSHLAFADTLDQAGITYAYFDVETFADYLSLMKICTDITGRADLYETNGTVLTAQIEETIETGKRDDAPSVLLLRTSSSRVKVLDSETMVGAMLKDLGCVNIADSNSGILTELSLEAIVDADPDYIFITCMGDLEEGKAQLAASLSSNPIWDTLQAVQSGRCHFLEKDLFQYKPNARWGESYEILAELLAAN